MSTDRLTAALERTRNLDQRAYLKHNGDRFVGSKDESAELAAGLLRADPTLICHHSEVVGVDLANGPDRTVRVPICPDPADHALAAAVRRHRDIVTGALHGQALLDIEAAITAALEDKP